MLVKDLREKANKLFQGQKGNWFKIFGIYLIIAYLQSGRSNVTIMYNSSSGEVNGASSVGALIGALIGVLITFVFYTLQKGALFKTLRIIRGQDDLATASFKDGKTGFTNFNVFTKYLWLNVLLVIFIGLWAILLLIPGLIKMYAYSLTNLVYYDALESGREMSYREAITESRRLMDGNKWTLFLATLVYNLQLFGLVIVFIFVTTFLLVHTPFIITFLLVDNPFIGLIALILLILFYLYLAAGIYVRIELVKVEMYHQLVDK